MTREEQIIEASQLYAKHQQKPFMDGALWADQNPNGEVLKLRKMFESDPDAYKQGYKDAVDKACEFLSKTIWNITYEDLEGNSTENTDKINFIETFKTYMKGE
jgi:hypothetical protein